MANHISFCTKEGNFKHYIFFQSVDTQTIPPARANYAATALQCIIFDYYQEDYAKKLKEKEDEKPKRVT